MGRREGRGLWGEGRGLAKVVGREKAEGGGKGKESWGTNVAACLGVRGLERSASLPPGRTGTGQHLHQGLNCGGLSSAFSSFVSLHYFAQIMN